MTDILSQDEINALLEAISAGVEESPDGYDPPTRTLNFYDFRRPQKFSREQVITIQMIHETFARLVTMSLSAQLRSLVAVHVDSVSQLSYEEFIRSIPNPTTIGIASMDPLPGLAAIEVDPSITFCILDRLLGGAGSVTKIFREISDIEMSIMEAVFVRMLGSLRESWSSVTDLRPRLGNIETNPQFAQVTPPEAMIVLIAMEAKIGDVEGMINLAIPYSTMESLGERLTSRYWYSPIKPSIEQQEAPARAADLAVEVIRVFASPPFSLKTLSGLKKGSKLGTATGRGMPLFKVQVGDPSGIASDHQINLQENES